MKSPAETESEETKGGGGGEVERRGSPRLGKVWEGRKKRNRKSGRKG